MKALEIKDKLIELECKEWKKGEMHRIYLDGIDARMCFDNEMARFGKSHEVFFDVKKGQFKCQNKAIENNLNSMISE